MKKVFLIGTLVVLVVVVVGVLGFLGYIPGIANIFGWSTPRDLGVVVTAQDYQSATEKLGRERLALPADSQDAITFQGSHAVDASFTQEEMTATWRTRDWDGNPFTDEGQIRINDDDTVEIAGAMNIPRLIDMVDDYAAVDEETRDLLNKAGFIKGDVAFWVHGNLEVTNGNWNIDISEAKLGRFSLPADQIPEGALEDAARKVVDEIAGMDITSLSFDNGMMHYTGTYPDQTYYRPAP